MLAEEDSYENNVTVEDTSWVENDIAADQNPRQDANAIFLVDMLDRMMDLEEKRKNVEKQIFENVNGARISFSRNAGFSGEKEHFSVEFAKFRDENLPPILGANHKRMIIHQDYAVLTSHLRISSRKKTDSQIVDNVRQASEASDANRDTIAKLRGTYGQAVGGVALPENDISWVKTLIQKHNTYYSQFVSKLKSVFYFALFNETWPSSGGKKNNKSRDHHNDGGDDDDNEENNHQQEAEEGRDR
jgi:hypothetical protein